MLNRNHDLSQPKPAEKPAPETKISESNDEIYLGSDRFIALSKENPKLLGEILQRQINQGMKELYQKKKAAGLSVHYSDPDYPNCWIREDADDRRFIVELDLTNGYKEKVIREIPPRHKSA